MNFPSLGPGELFAIGSSLTYSGTLICVRQGMRTATHGIHTTAERLDWRSLTFQLAEVAVPRALFEKILGLISGLRPLAQPT